MPGNAVFSMVCRLLVKIQKYRILLEHGVVWYQNGVVNESEIEDGDVKYRNEKGLETHVFSRGGNAWVFLLLKLHEVSLLDFG